ncbi:hypothetical protein KIPB_010416, partial [Kipferlia bialata]
ALNTSSDRQRAEIETVLRKKADVTAVNATLNQIRSQNDAVSADMATKADAQQVASELEQRALVSDVNAALQQMASKASVTSALRKKANRADVDKALADLASITDVNEALRGKADVDSLNAALELRPTQSDVSQYVEGRIAEVQRESVESIQSLVAVTDRLARDTVQRADFEGWAGDMTRSIREHADKTQTKLLARTSALETQVSSQTDRMDAVLSTHGEQVAQFIQASE